MMHDLRSISPETPFSEDHSIQVLGGGVFGYSPMKVSLPEEHDQDEQESVDEKPAKVRPYGYEGFFTLGAVFAHGKKIQGNTRLSVGTYLSAGNQPHSHEVGQADVESFEPHPDDSAQDGLVGKFDFSQNSAFFAVPLTQIDTMIKLRSAEETERRLLFWVGSKAQGVNAWNLSTLSAKTDSIYFRTNHTLLGLGGTFYLKKNDWSSSWSLAYRHANDGDLFLAEQNISDRFFNNWKYHFMVYAGAKKQKVFESEEHEEEEEPIPMQLGWMTAYGASFFLDIPFDLLKVQTGVATGSLHAQKDMGLDPVSNLYKLMPRNHYLVRPFGFVNVPVKKSELGFGLSWYGGLQNYVTHPGDAAVVKRTSSIEARLNWTSEFLRRSHHVDFMFFLGYLYDSQKFYLASGDLFRKNDSLVIFGLQIFYENTSPLKKLQSKRKQNQR